MVAVEKKDGNLRICIGPTDLNKAMTHPFYPIPTLEDATTNLHRDKYSSKMDAISGMLVTHSRHRKFPYDNLQRYPWQILLQKNAIWFNISPR
ncbi:hypothetical protein QYM36_019081 [Artemia franciscana]|uniref:Uncharacterized protein n=1 Tax=Artemia franciscana TaxID=6661 RepID=A0AA88HBF5_ARTSF|nr:hypothetical protein QYM36_019081 [Artemia franciscana]